VSGITATIVDGVRQTIALREALHDVDEFIRQYVVLSREQSILTTLWTAETYAIDAFEYVAYLHVKSPLPECGKTRLLEVLESLVYKPWLTGRVTAAVLMRKVDAEQPVLLLDESDAAFNSDKEYSEALRGMLNTGFHRSGKASACIGQGAHLTYKDFGTFGPKAIAGIGALPSTVESRSIPISLKRRRKDEPVTKWRRREAWHTATALRTRLATAMRSAVSQLRDARPAMPDGLSDRAEDVLEPLFAIAELAGDAWSWRARTAAIALMGDAARSTQEVDRAIGLALLEDLRSVFAAEGDPEALATRDILTALTAMDDRPWATFTKEDKPITPHRLAKLLKDFDVPPAGNVRFGEKVLRGYSVAAFADAFSRYLPSKALQRYNANENGSEPAKTEALQDTPVADAENAVSYDEH
jgi:hypothetical protein